MKKKLALTLCAAGFTSGCATTPETPSYDASHSRAYNLAKAGGLYGAKDYAVPASQRSGALAKGWSVSGDAVLFNARQGIGLDWGKSLGLGLLTTAFSPKGVMERDSVFAWMPATQASDSHHAWELMSATLLTGIEQTLQHAGVKYVVDNKNRHQDLPLMAEYILSSVRIVAPQKGCPGWEASGHSYEKSCSISTLVYAPTEQPRAIPDFVMAHQQGYAFLAGDDVEYSRIKVTIPEGATLDKNSLLASISKELPAWAAIFVASQRQAKGQYSAPVVLEQGRAELFITPE